jgi:hypothetical protein
MKYYYDLENVSTLNFIPYINNGVYSGVSMTKLKNKKNNQYNGNQITFVGYRLIQHYPFNTAKYNETITLQVYNGMLVASQIYDDSGSGFDTTVSFVKYMIHNGSGIFNGKKWLKITFDNTSNPKKRVIEIN